MKQSFCPCVAFLVAEVGCISTCPESVANGKVCCCTGVVELSSRVSTVTKSGAGPGEDPFAPVKDLTTESISRLHSQASSEADHMPHRDDELTNPSEKKADLDNQVATDTFKLEAAVSQFSVLDGESAEVHVDLCFVNTATERGREA